MAGSARRGALWLLGQVLGEGRLMSDLTAAPQHRKLDPADRARAQRLALEVLRGLERADRVLKPYLRKMPPLAVRNVLRLATVELCTGGDAHGVVNEAVALTRAGKRTAAHGGLVNAVLRKVAGDGPETWAALRVPHLPKWLRGPLVQAWGAEAVRAMEAAHFAGAPLDLTLRGDASGWAARLEAEALPTGSLRRRAPGQVSALPGFAEGEWWVQDAAAALPVQGLGDVAGLSVLDLCAAPGGKTLQLAARGAEVTALDISEARLGRLRENLARTGLAATVVAGDALTAQGLYDAVVLDAPCSATGTIRRHPDLPLARSGEEIGGLIALQAALLDHALSLLKPGGRLIYCTCSLLPDEGECQVEEALARHDGLRVLPGAFDLPGVDPAWRTSEGGLRLRPDYWAERGGMDGFYMACLTR
ncbi:MAG: methyltransferase domain-containing protein [Rhodobacteraceae bacterium]|nr:MAG: methyltransferase domain-containing protein [Paracoccaceae bacterium]